MPNKESSNLLTKNALAIVGAIVVLGVLGFAATKQRTSDEMKVGVIAPLSGNFAVFGERIRNSMELAKSDLLKEDSNRKIDIVVEDACQAQQAVSAAKKLIEVDKVNLIGGSFCLVGFVPNIRYFEQNKVIAFNTAANPDSTLNNPYVFSTNKSIKDDAGKLANFASEKIKAKTAASVYYTTPLGLDYGKYFDQQFKTDGGQITSSQQVSLEATDFRTELAKIKEQNPDLIFVVHLAKPLGTFIKQARELGIKATILSHSEAEDPNVIQAAGAHAEGMFISSSEAPQKSAHIQAFETAYKERFGSAPDVIAANAYDALRLQVQVFEKCNGDTDCMRSELHKVRNYDGVSGLITIAEDGSTSKPILFKVVKDGQFVRSE